MTNNQSSQSAFRRLIIVIVVAIGLMIYAYGWTITDIDLETPQEPDRQVNVQNAMRELLSPRIFEQDRELSAVTADFLINCEEGDTPAKNTESSAPYVVINPTCGLAGDVITVQAFNFAADAEARIRWIPLEGQRRPRDVLETGREEIVLNSEGGFEGTIEVPRMGGSTGQTHQVEFVAAIPSGSVRFSEVTTEVARRMAETIFMALLATSIAIPPAAFLSFLAAQNLMKSVRLPMGNLMISIIGLPIGWWFGTMLLGEIGAFAVNLTQGQIGTGAALIPLVWGAVATSKQLSQPEETLPRAIAGQIGVAFGFVLILGLVGGLAISSNSLFSEIGDILRPNSNEGVLGWTITAFADGIAAIGRMLEIFGGLIELSIRELGGLVGALTVSSLLTSLSRDALSKLTGMMEHGVAAILGIIVGFIIFGVVAEISATVALFGLLPPTTAAIVGSQIGVLLYKRFVLNGRTKPHISSAEQILQTLISWVGAIAAFALVFIQLRVGRAIIDGTLPNMHMVDLMGIEISQYTLTAMLFGGILMGIMGLLTGLHAPFMVGMVLYNLTRTILNMLRSIEPLIMGLIFVVWVGIGPFAGVLALTLHSIASLGKLYSEQIENIDEGPLEALKATGATHLQTVIYAVVPQIVPPYIAFTMYRWDINVRMSTIIGFVGGGGIGLLLNQYINLLRYREAGVAVLAIAIVVSILDYASAAIRERAI